MVNNKIEIYVHFFFKYDLIATLFFSIKMVWFYPAFSVNQEQERDGVVPLEINNFSIHGNIFSVLTVLILEKFYLNFLITLAAVSAHQEQEGDGGIPLQDPQQEHGRAAALRHTGFFLGFSFYSADCRSFM